MTQITRRNVLKGIAATALTSSFTPPAAAQERSRQLIAPREFLERLSDAEKTGNPDTYMAVQRDYEIYKSGAEISAKIILHPGEVGQRTININVNVDNLLRHKANIANADGTIPFIDARPTIAFMQDIHKALYNINPNDPQAPKTDDALNFEWRSRRQVTDGAQVPQTWDEFRDHLITFHGAFKDDINQAFLMARLTIRSLNANGQVASPSNTNTEENTLALALEHQEEQSLTPA